MIDLKAMDDLARRLSDLVPPGIKDARAEIEQNMKSTLQAGLAKLDLVTRELVVVGPPVAGRGPGRPVGASRCPPDGRPCRTSPGSR